MTHPSNKPTIENIAELFTYHKPTLAQVRAYGNINDAAVLLALAIINNCPDCADRDAAVRMVREARMMANASIACAPTAPEEVR